MPDEPIILRTSTNDTHQMDAATYAAIRAEAERLGISMSEFVTLCFHAWCAQQQEIYPTSESKRAFDDFKRRRSRARDSQISNTGDIVERGNQRNGSSEELISRSISQIERSQGRTLTIDDFLAMVNANAEMARALTAIAQQQQATPPPTLAPEPTASQKPWRPMIHEWREGYERFWRYMCGIEDKLPRHLRQQKNAYQDRIHTRGGSVRRINEGMEHYHVRTEQTDLWWPPSQWPAHEPTEADMFARLRELRQYVKFAAIILFNTLAFDLFADPRLDGVVRFVKHCLEQI
jgi:hypothetical protein